MIALILATWRVTYMMLYEDGPYMTFRKLRLGARVGEVDAPVIGQAMACFWCFSIWVGAVIALMPQWAVRSLAASAGAIAFDEWREKRLS